MGRPVFHIFSSKAALWLLPSAALAFLLVSPLTADAGPDTKPVLFGPPAPRVSFTNDVIPVLTRLGCNTGSCHGQQSGKGGFRLSLRGWDPAFDHEQITRDSNGRRVRPADPTGSLLLRKPTGQTAHGGGQVFKTYSPEYRLLLRWLTEGRRGPDDKEARLTAVTVSPAETAFPTPGRGAQITVTASYSDTTRRDVTRLARYQSQNDAVAAVDDNGRIMTRGPGESAILVTYGGFVRTSSVLVPFAKPTSAAIPARFDAKADIDALVERKLDRLGLAPSGLCTDAEFIRRVTLDTTGLLPTPDETRAFLRDTAPDKRAKLVDRLLERPEYVDNRALKLADMLRVNGQYLSEEGADVYYRWIREQVAANVPYDRFVRTLLAGRGSGFHVGPANYYRVAQNPEELAETTAETFLGTRIACAKCHNHPFENWKQNDYYGVAAFFARYGRKGGPEFGEEQVFVKRDGEAENPRTKKPVPMHFLGGETVTGEPDADRRVTLARWLTAPDNRAFARVAVNRLWSDYFGRGIVEPVDDFRISNPPSNGPLLETLTDAFLQSGYDVKATTRLILNSRAYQRSSVILPGNARDDRYFARAYPRRLPAETLLDTVGEVTGKPERFYPYPAGWRASQIRDSRVGHYFLEVFGRPKREIVCACERSPQPNLAQALHLMNSGSINNKLASGDGRVAQLVKQFEPWAPAIRDRRIVEEMYVLTLCRPPSPAEVKAMTTHVAQAKDRKKGLEDVLWALLNSEEYLFNK